MPSSVLLLLLCSGSETSFGQSHKHVCTRVNKNIYYGTAHASSHETLQGGKHVTTGMKMQAATGLGHSGFGITLPGMFSTWLQTVHFKRIQKYTASTTTV